MKRRAQSPTVPLRKTQPKKKMSRITDYFPSATKAAEGTAAGGDVTKQKVSEHKWTTVNDGLLRFNFTPSSTTTTTTSKNNFKLAAFDLDQTLFMPKEGRRFPRDQNDWQFFHPSVKAKLRSLQEQDGFTLTVFSNQFGLMASNKRMEVFKKRLESFALNLKLPFVAYFATKRDHCRKPLTGMFERFLKDLSVESVDYEASFYVGDAAGRVKGWKHSSSADHSDCDRKFAINCGLKFYTPEQFFLGEAEVSQQHWKYSYDPKDFLSSNDHDDFRHRLRSSSEESDVVLIVGGPSAGKTHFSEKYFGDHLLVDLSKTVLFAKKKESIHEALQKSSRIVIEGRFSNAKERQHVIQIAKEEGQKVRCFVLSHNSHENFLKHMNHYSSIKNSTPLDSDEIKKQINRYLQQYTEPTQSEGFSEVYKVPFIPHFSDEADQKLFSKFLF